MEERLRFVALIENVDGHRDLGLDRTFFDLEALGYAGRPFWIPACAVGAPHDRMRVWIVASAIGLADAGNGQFSQPELQPQGRDGARSTGAPVGELVNAARERRGEGRAEPEFRGGRATAPGAGGANGNPWCDAIWVECADGKLRRTQPGLGLLAHGVSERVARLRALGNAIVPQVAAQILSAIIASEASQ